MSSLFETERLSIRELTPADKDFFIELLSASEIVDPIPQPPWPMEEILAKFNDFIDYPKDLLSKDQVVWGVFEKDHMELIGLNGLLTNDENQKELGYRFRKKYWGKGYATEVTYHMINFCFKQLNIELITADVYINNTASVKVLEKFFTPVREFENKEDGCIDRRYQIRKKDWNH